MAFGCQGKNDSRSPLFSTFFRDGRTLSVRRVRLILAAPWFSLGRCRSHRTSHPCGSRLWARLTRRLDPAPGHRWPQKILGTLTCPSALENPFSDRSRVTDQMASGRNRSPIQPRDGSRQRQLTQTWSTFEYVSRLGPWLIRSHGCQPTPYRAHDPSPLLISPYKAFLIQSPA